MRLLRHLRSQEGITLIMAIGILGVLSISGATLIYYSSANARSATASKGNETAYTLAEAGIAQALSVLNNAVSPLTGTLLPSTTVQLEGGSVTYSGTLNSTTWSITATGTVPNPTGGTAITRTLTRSAEVYGINSGATVGAWSRWYADSTQCLTITDVTINMPIGTRGGLCLSGTATVEGASTTVEVGGNVTMTPSTASSQKNTSSGSQNGTGTAWSGPTNIYSSNNSYSTAALNKSTSSNNLDAKSFGFSIPAAATIKGIVVVVELGASNTNSIQEVDFYLLKNSAAVGTNKATTTYWPTPDTAWSRGGNTDLWGTTWTPAEINSSNFGVRIKVRNVNSSSSRTAYVDHVYVTVHYEQTPLPSIGTSGVPVAAVRVAGTCKFSSQAAHTPCTSDDRVWGNSIDSAPQNLSMPSVDLAYWYTNAKPGPKNNCTTGSFPGGFDNNTKRDNSLSGSAEVTPKNSSYTCQVKDAQGNILGELSWNHVTKVLKIKGTVFIDGDFRFDDDGEISHYQGRGIIYASGDLEFDELVCAGGSGNTSCVTEGMANWDPSQNMMIVLAGGSSEYDQGGSQSASVPSGFQGLIYAKGDCTVHENFHTSGPIVCNKINLPSSSNGWPTYYSWPPLGSLVEGQVYADPFSAGDHIVIPGAQSG